MVAAPSGGVREKEEEIRAMLVNALHYRKSLYRKTRR